MFATLALCLALVTPPPEKEVPIVILGSGVAALTAALQASQAGVQPVIISGPNPGGVITQSYSIQNWPAEIDITGADLVDKIQKQIESRGVKLATAEVIAIDTSKRPFEITTRHLLDHKIEKIRARTCIVALGASARLLNVPGESDLLYRKIFTCAPCDGLRFKDKTVAIIGGGDTALTEAAYLSNIAKKIYVVVRGGKLKTTKLVEKPNIEYIYDSPVQSFTTTDDQITLHLPSKNLPVDGAFLAIGSIPNTSLFRGKLELDSDGYIVLKDNQQTSVPGIFAAGDISDRQFRQAITAAGDATKAVLQAQKEYHTTVPTLPELTTVSELRNFIARPKNYAVVYFYGTTCPPCRVFRSTYAEWAEKYQHLASFAKVNDRTAQECFAAYNIQAMPTILVFDSHGKLIHKATGLYEINKIPSIITHTK